MLVLVRSCLLETSRACKPPWLGADLPLLFCSSHLYLMTSPKDMQPATTYRVTKGTEQPVIAWTLACNVRRSLQLSRARPVVTCRIGY